MSDGGRERASLEVKVWKSSQKWSGQRSAVRSIAWLDGWVEISEDNHSRVRQNGDVVQHASPAPRR
jgi:hypothetical protein